MQHRRRVLVTGSREWSDWRAIRTYLSLEQLGLFNHEMTLVHGDCPRGADRIAKAFATDWQWNVEPHPAQWLTGLGMSAGFARNRQMVELGADVCLAFSMRCTDMRCRIEEPHGTHGTSHCAGLAGRAGIPVRWVRRGW